MELSGQPPRNYTELLLLVWLGLLVFLIVGGWSLARRAHDQMLGGGMLPGVLKSPARRYAVDAQRVTFNDVAGLGNVKKDLQEIVDYLRRPGQVSEAWVHGYPKAFC